ncbi:MAG: c-type cytochrome [Anaerolineae bacterium]|nr:c-type cytochrome [Anaerolineae bacterium]
MQRTSKVAVAALVAVLLLALSVSSAFAQDPDAGQAAWEGEVWQCSACHGGEGEGLFGRPLSNSTLSADEWIDQVRNPRNFMPRFSADQVTDQQITDIHAYITSLPAPADFTRMSVELPPDAPEGQQLIVQNNCVACHGETGPIERFIDRGETPTAERVIAQLRTPFSLMPSFSEDQVSDADAALIAEFMAAQIAEQAPPEALPQAGEASSTPTTLLLLFGSGLLLVLGGLVARRMVANI